MYGAPGNSGSNAFVPSVVGLIIAGEVVKDLTNADTRAKDENGRKRHEDLTIEELEQLTPGSVTIVDVRPADTYQRGTFEGAINVPMKEFVDRYEEIPKDKPVWVLCHTGERSLDYVELLCSHGYDAGNITGGYRAYLRLQLGALHEMKRTQEKKRPRRSSEA